MADGRSLLTHLIHFPLAWLRNYKGKGFTNAPKKTIGPMILIEREILVIELSLMQSGISVRGGGWD